MVNFNTQKCILLIFRYITSLLHTKEQKNYKLTKNKESSNRRSSRRCSKSDMISDRQGLMCYRYQYVIPGDECRQANKR